jgi:hypothetical protein
MAIFTICLISLKLEGTKRTLCIIICLNKVVRGPLVNTATFLRKTPRFSRVNRKVEKIVKTPPFLRYILKLTFFQGFCPAFYWAT